MPASFDPSLNVIESNRNFCTEAFRNRLLVALVSVRFIIDSIHLFTNTWRSIVSALIAVTMNRTKATHPKRIQLFMVERYWLILLKISLDTSKVRKETELGY